MSKVKIHYLKDKEDWGPSDHIRMSVPIWCKTSGWKSASSEWVNVTCRRCEVNSATTYFRSIGAL